MRVAETETMQEPVIFSVGVSGVRLFLLEGRSQQDQQRKWNEEDEDGR